MRLILSRKGFDAASAGAPSPILPDGRLLSLPIPRAGESLRYRDVRHDGDSLGPVVEALTDGRVSADAPCHLDPDLRAGARPRPEGWRPLFGQAGASAGHLANQAVGSGDLFLFFGWFRRTERVEGRLRFVPGARDLHVLFGWLQVGAVHPEPARRSRELPPWARKHPHADPGRSRTNNVLFEAAPELDVGGGGPAVPGGGAFETPTDSRILTADGRSRSVWRVPRALWRDEPEDRLTYHGRRDRWTLDGEGALLRTVGQGQEFVLPVQGRGERAWVKTLFDGAEDDLPEGARAGR